MDARRELQGDADAPALRQCFERVQGGKFPGRLRRNVRAICRRHAGIAGRLRRSEEHTSELQSLMRISYAVFCLKKKNENNHALDKKQSKQDLKTNKNTEKRTYINIYQK